MDIMIKKLVFQYIKINSIWTKQNYYKTELKDKINVKMWNFFFGTFLNFIIYD